MSHILQTGQEIKTPVRLFCADFPSGTAILTVSFSPGASAILFKAEMEGFAVPRSIFDTISCGF